MNDKKVKIGIARQIVESADETVRTAELRYGTGKLSAFELIDAQNVYARSQQDFFNARVDYRIALEELAVICPAVLNAKETGE
jgi:outer membrane protein TolC